MYRNGSTELGRDYPQNPFDEGVQAELQKSAKQAAGRLRARMEDVAIGAGPAKEVPAAIDFLFQEVDQLENLTATLAERTIPIRSDRPSGPSATNEDTPPAAFAATLTVIGRRLQEVNSRLAYIHNTLELP